MTTTIYHDLASLTSPGKSALISIPILTITTTLKGVTTLHIMHHPTQPPTAMDDEYDLPRSGQLDQP